MPNNPPSIAIVGATGAVGREMLEVLEQRRFPHGAIRLFASPRSAGVTIRYRGEPTPVEATADGCLRGIDIALFSAGSGVSKHLGPVAVGQGVIVVDNSSAFRADAGCPLVIPEVNPEALPAERPCRPVLIANPNCSTIIMLMALTPLRRAFGIERVVVSTYQAASGAGAQAMEELRAQSEAVLGGKAAEPKIFHEPYAFNLFSHNAGVDPVTGYNGEELKMISETRRIWSDPGALVDPTCIRVPTMRAHAQAINVTLKVPATERQVREALQGARGVRIVDDRGANLFPTPLKASGGDDVLVGRIRPDLSRLHAEHGPAFTPGSDTECRAFNLFIAGDQLRKGAALNAVQIAEMVMR